MRTTEYSDFIAYKRGHICEIDDGLISNWPTFEGFAGQQRREDKTVFFIDDRVTGMTKGEAYDLDTAKRLAKELGGVVRPYVLTEENIHEDNERIREMKRLGII